MARFLVGTIAAIGHVNPALPIVRQLVAQGHEVWWYTGQGFKAKVEATGAHHVPVEASTLLYPTAFQKSGQNDAMP